MDRCCFCQEIVLSDEEHSCLAIRMLNQKDEEIRTLKASLEFNQKEMSQLRQLARLT